MSRARTAALALAVSCLFQSQRPARAGDDEKKAVLDLMHVIMPRETYAAMMDQMQSQMIATMAQGGTQVPPDKAAKIKAAVSECVPYEDVVSWSADIYASRLTIAEIKDLAAFYKTPTGKKVVRLMPEIGGEIGKKMAPMLMERLPVALKKHGLQ